MNASRKISAGKIPGLSTLQTLQFVPNARTYVLHRNKYTIIGNQPNDDTQQPLEPSSISLSSFSPYEFMFLEADKDGSLTDCNGESIILYTIKYI